MHFPANELPCLRASDITKVYFTLVMMTNQYFLNKTLLSKVRVVEQY